MATGHPWPGVGLFDSQPQRAREGMAFHRMAHLPASATAPAFGRRETSTVPDRPLRLLRVSTFAFTFGFVFFEPAAT
jgi:hypothetical protein